ncbi:hypothetical protein BBO99_00000482 [Phytophthora kernoviae]|uniref:WIBG Mago-binding domain-containing protein n=2 Tax=Phytophthora kernoviae TaxID=325452 RepID=A0A3R7KZ05_9STRA|nr:hypothetical protein G195_003179 [Phytophthora kernoviae 00238/432]KAG2526903.1 hypothetical protein JM18_004077 [Phytophthora kernoviae]KAG2529011.1 hypothetical protein JM16_002332 [Phytophthora kernoviae]RLN32168.1 hypothetical protein BBI17_001656 [Phytophthora kernoviae]RLN85584.1 hypothetical protein BBO99_00000482 [Phytophthora kernoviae]
MSEEKQPRLPLGAVRTDDGQVVVPASRRADGSTRKPIRIRQGYMPQDEVPKYKTIAQRRREQEAKRATEERTGGASNRSTVDAAVDELPMDALSLKPKKESPRSQDRLLSSGARGSRQDRQRQAQAHGDATAATDTAPASAGDHQQLKKQLTKINKQLKEITQLQDTSTAPLTAQQEQKIARKQELQQLRNEIIAELNGATVTKSHSAAGSRPKVAISL